MRTKASIRFIGESLGRRREDDQRSFISAENSCGFCSGETPKFLKLSRRMRGRMLVADASCGSPFLMLPAAD